MSDVSGTAPGNEQQDAPSQVSEEEARKYLDQLRSAPAEEVVADVLSSLLTAAQAKLGRRDARLLIDMSGLVHEHARPYVPEQLTTQVDQVLAQLRFGQLEAEKHVAAQAQEEANDLAQAPAPPAAGQQPSGQSAPPPSPQQPPAASKLWVPGRQ